MEEKKPAMDLDAFIKKAVAQAREIKANKQGKIKKVSGETQRLINESQEALDRFKKAQLDFNWKDMAVVMMIHEVTCKTCGSIYLSPNSHIFVKRVNRLVGVHYKAIDGGLGAFQHLPQESEYRRDSTLVCQRCFTKKLPDGMSYRERELAISDRIQPDY
jgi:hypothetical protein